MFCFTDSINIITVADVVCNSDAAAKKEIIVRDLKVNDRIINDEGPCYIIAEIGHNHQGSLETAKKMVLTAKECGANAVKLQKRDNKTLFTSEIYNSPYDNENSYGATYGEHREALEFGKIEYSELID